MQPPRPPEPGLLLQVDPAELMDAGSELEEVADIWAADARAARAAAGLAVWIARLARRRRLDRAARDAQLCALAGRGGPGTDTLDRRPPVLTDVCEGFVPELALLRRCSEAEAAVLAVGSLVLVERLPAVWSALYAGRIDRRRAAVLADLLGEVSDATAAAVLARVLLPAGESTAARLRERTRRALAQVDPDALAARRQRAARRADVTVRPVAEGLSALVAELPPAEALACREAVRRLADQQRAGGDDRPIGVIRAGVVHDLVLRPWDTSRPPVTAHLTVHADLPALCPTAPTQPACEIDGVVVPATECRALLTGLGVLGVAAAPRGGSVTVAVHGPTTGALRAVATRQELARAAGRTRRHRHRNHGRAGGSPDRGVDTATCPRGDSSASGPVDEQTSAGPGLRRPAATRRYRPTAA
ncbi:DUF222 domain-containing protein [Geodermatophilus sp. SYSU D00758]